MSLECKFEGRRQPRGPAIDRGGAIIELREAAYLASVPPTDYADEGDSGAEEGEEEEEEAAVVIGGGDEIVVKGEGMR